MKTWKLFFAFFMAILGGCTENETPLAPYKGPFAIFVEHDILCVGQSSKVHAVVLDTWQEIPVSDLEFESLDPVNGKISTGGIYTAPENLTQNRVIKLKAKFKNGAKDQLTGEINISPTGSFPNTWVKQISEQVNINSPYDVFENGDLLIGLNLQTMDTGFTNEIMRITPEGKLIWKKNLGSGISKFLKVTRDKIYSFVLKQVEGNNLFDNKFTVMDLQGEIIEEFKLQSLENIWAISVDEDGYIYVALLKLDRKNSLIIKIDEKGSMISTYQFPNQIITDFKVTKEKNIIGLRIIPDIIGGDEVLFMLDTEGKEIWSRTVERSEFPGASSKLFLLPSGQIGLGKLQGFSQTNWVLDIINLDGTMAQSNKVLHSSTRDINQNSGPKNSKKNRLYLIDHVFLAKNEEIYFVGISWNEYFTFLEVVSLSGNHWNWWQNNSSGDLYPVSISEFNDGIVLIADMGPQVLSFKLDYDLNFDPCLYNTLWGIE